MIIYVTMPRENGQTGPLTAKEIDHSLAVVTKSGLEFVAMLGDFWVFKRTLSDAEVADLARDRITKS